MIGIKDDSGKTALMIACSENESTDIAELLIKHGAKILDHDHNGHTPIFEAGLCENRRFNSRKIYWVTPTVTSFIRPSFDCELCQINMY